MVHLPPFVLTATVAWFVLCMLWFAVLARRWLAQRKAVGPRGYPGALLNGVFLVAIAPAVSVVQYIGSRHQAFWGGAADLLTGGLFLIGYHFFIKRRLIDWVARPTVMTFREKSIVSEILAILVVYGFYGVRLWGQPLTRLEAGSTLIGITVLMIIISIASHVAIAVYAGPERAGERDRVVALRGSRNAYRALAAGIWCAVLLAIARAPYALLFYAVMGAFALAELVRLGSELVYYRLRA